MTDPLDRLLELHEHEHFATWTEEEYEEYQLLKPKIKQELLQWSKFKSTFATDDNWDLPQDIIEKAKKWTQFGSEAEIIKAYETVCIKNKKLSEEIEQLKTKINRLEDKL